MTSVGNNMEKREPLSTVGWNVSWCTHYGKQHEVSFKIKNRTTRLPGGPVVKSPRCNAGDVGSTPGP